MIVKKKKAWNKQNALFAITNSAFISTLMLIEVFLHNEEYFFMTF